MIDTKHFEVLETEGYVNKRDAYDQIRNCYEGVSGVTTYYASEEGLWYIVQSKTIRQ